MAPARAQVAKVNADLHGRAWLRQETFLGAAEGQDRRVEGKGAYTASGTAHGRLNDFGVPRWNVAPGAVPRAIMEDESIMLILGCKRRRLQEPISRKLQAAGGGERRLELAGRLAMQATVVTDQGIQRFVVEIDERPRGTIEHGRSQLARKQAPPA